MLTSYHFSMTGRAHIQMGKECQDSSSVVEITPAWKAVIAADGVGSCDHADIASQIAVETVGNVLKASFPGNKGTDRDFQSLMLIAAHTAANAVEDYIRKNDPENAEQYHTTLAMALCSSKTAYYLNVGDSAIVGLDENGKWHSITHPDNDEKGGVYTLSWRDHYHVGKVKFQPVCVLALTDGVYNRCFPHAMKGEPYEMDVPLLNFFVNYAFGIEDANAEADSETQKQNIQKFFASDACRDMTDDLSIAAVINTQTFLEEDDIPFEVDWFRIYWKSLQATPYDDAVKQKQFASFIQEYYNDFTEKQVKEFAEQYIHPVEIPSDTNANQATVEKEEKEIKKVEIQKQRRLL